MTRWRCVCQFVVAGSLVCGISASAHAQVFGFAGGEADPEKQMEAFYNQQKKGFELKLAIRIDEMKRVCELSESQEKKLQIAAKGAVARTIQRMKKQMQNAGNGGAVFGAPRVVLNVARGVPAKDAEDDSDDGDDEDQEGDEPAPDQDADDEDDDDEGDDAPVEAIAAAVPQIAFQARMIAPAFNSGPMAVDREAVWKKTIEKVLTKEQFTAYQSALADRVVYQRQNAVRNFVSRVDRQLLLSQEQREKLTDVVDKKMGQQLVQQQNQEHQFGVVRMLGMGGGSSRISAKDVASIFSKPQLDQWKVSFAPQLNRPQGMWQAMAAPLPAVPLRPAARVEVNAKTQTALGVTVKEDDEGIIVERVANRTPFAKAGLKKGDIVSNVNGKDVKSMKDFIRGIAGARIGKPVTLKGTRGDDEFVVKLNDPDE